MFSSVAHTQYAHHLCFQLFGVFFWQLQRGFAVTCRHCWDLSDYKNMIERET